jgi:hypothetical protein
MVGIRSKSGRFKVKRHLPLMMKPEPELENDDVKKGQGNDPGKDNNKNGLYFSLWAHLLIDSLHAKV